MSGENPPSAVQVVSLTPIPLPRLFGLSAGTMMRKGFDITKNSVCR